MRQDLIDWLNGRGEAQETGLFLAPFGVSENPQPPEPSPVQPEPEPEPSQPEPALEPVQPEAGPESLQESNLPVPDPETEALNVGEGGLFEPDADGLDEEEPDLFEPVERGEEAREEGQAPPFEAGGLEEDVLQPDEDAWEEDAAETPKFRPLGSSGEYDALPNLWPAMGQPEGGFEDYEGTLVIQKLHNTMQQRKNQAEERRELDPKPRRPRVLLWGFLLLFLILLLAGAGVAVWYFRGPEVLAVPAETEPVQPRPVDLERKPAPPLSPSLEDTVQRGTEALRQGRWDDAILLFAQAIRQRPGDVRPRLGMAGAYRAKGMGFDAVRVLQEAQKRFPEDLTIQETLRQLRTR